MSCVVPGCNSLDLIFKDEHTPISYHRAPKNMKTKWAQALFNDKSFWWSHYEVCSLHFRKEDIKIENNKAILRPKAVPVLHLNVKSPLEKLMMPIDLEKIEEVKGPPDTSKVAGKKEPQNLPMFDKSFSFRVNPERCELGDTLYSRNLLEGIALRYTNNYRSMMRSPKYHKKVKLFDPKKYYHNIKDDRALAIHRDVFYMKMQVINKMENSPNLTEEDMKSEPRWLITMVSLLQPLRQGKYHDERREAAEELFACKPWLDYLNTLRKEHATLRGEALYAALSASCDVPAQYLGPYWESQVREWSNNLRLSLCAGDAWGVPTANVAVYCGDITLLTNNVQKSKRAKKSLYKLINLVTAIRDKKLHSALLWAALLEAINSSGHQVSAEILQRRWYELVRGARRLALRPTPIDTTFRRISPPCRAFLLMLERFPEIVTSPIKSWKWLIENNRIYTDDILKNIPKSMIQDILKEFHPKKDESKSNKTQENSDFSKPKSPITNTEDISLPDDIDFNEVKREVIFYDHSEDDDNDDDGYKVDYDDKKISETKIEISEESGDKNENEWKIKGVDCNIIGILGITGGMFEDALENIDTPEESDYDDDEDSLDRLVIDEKPNIVEIEIEEQNLEESISQSVQEELPQKTKDVKINDFKDNNVLNPLKGTFNTSNLKANNTISKENNKRANDEVKAESNNDTSKNSIVPKEINQNSIVKEKGDETITLGGRLAKIVHLQDIESVRRINKGILTAQVAPIKKVPETPTNTEDAIRSLPEIDPKHKNDSEPEDELKNENSDIDNETTVTSNELEGIINNLKALKQPKQLFCCAAQQHIYMSSGRYLKAIEQGSIYEWTTHKHKNCTCCCKDLVKAIPKRLLKKYKSKRKKKTCRPEPAPLPEPELHSLEDSDGYLEWNRQKDLANKLFGLKAKPSSTNYITLDKIKNPIRIDSRSSTEDNGSVTLTTASNMPMISVKVVKSSHDQPLMSLEPADTQKDENTFTILSDDSDEVDVNDDNVRDTTPSAHVEETSINFDIDTSNDTISSGPEHDVPTKELYLEEVSHTTPRVANANKISFNKDPVNSNSKRITSNIPKVAVQYLRSNINANYINNSIKNKTKPSGPYTSSKEFFADHNHLPKNIFVLKVERDSIPIRLTDRIILVTTDSVTCDHPQLYSVENGRRLAFLTPKQTSAAKRALTIDFPPDSPFERKLHIISAISTFEIARSKILKRAALLYDSLNFDLVPLFPCGISSGFSLMTVSRYAHLMPSLEKRFSDINIDLLSSSDDEDDTNVTAKKTCKKNTKKRSKIKNDIVTISDTTSGNDSDAEGTNIDKSEPEINLEIINEESDLFENVGANVSGEKRTHADTHCDISKRLKTEN